VPETLTAPAVGRPQRTDVVLIAVALTAVSTSGPLIAATAVPALAIAFWRNALASGLLLPAALVTCRDELRGLDRRELRLAGVAGVMLALHFATWTPGADVHLGGLRDRPRRDQPVWAALISGWRGVPVGRAVWTGIGVAMSGALLLAVVDLRVSGEALVGDLLALAGGAFAALYMTAGSEVRRSVSTTTYTLLCYSTTALLLLVVCVVAPAAAERVRRRRLAEAARPHPGRPAARALAVQPRAQDDGRHAVSMLILLEIPGAALIAAVFLGQTPPLLALPAAVLLLTGLAIVIRAGSRATVPAVPVE
jgi:drug/metabolite transporter (DMT)-like permease